MAWDTSARRATLPPNWPAIVARTQVRAGGQCEQVTEGVRCSRAGSECDHKGHRFDHANTQWLCTEHHKVKTQAEAQAARAQQRAKLSHPATRRTSPGLLG